MSTVPQFLTGRCFRSPCHFLFFRLDLRLDLHNHFRQLFFAFFSCFRVDIVAFPLATRIRRRVPPLIEVVVNHGDTARAGLAYFRLVRREFDRGGIFPCRRLSRRHPSVCAADFAVDIHRRLPLHGIGDVAVNIQRSCRGHMADGCRKRFHIHIICIKISDA